MENEVKIADYIQRMIDEKKELDGRIAKLVAFRYSEKADEILAMTRYSDTLGRRIYNEKVKTGVIAPPSPLSQNREGCCVAPRY